MGDVEKVSPSVNREIEGQIHQTSSYSNFNARQRPSSSSGIVADLVDRDSNAPTFEHCDPVWHKHWKVQCQHSAWMLHTELYKIEGHDEDVNETDFFRGYVPPEEAHPSATRPVQQTQDRRYIVDGGASLLLLGYTSLTPQGSKNYSKNKQCLGYSDTQRRG